MSQQYRSPTPTSGGGGGGGGLVIVGFLVVGAAIWNFPAVLAIGVILAGKLWLLVASIAIGAAHSFQIVIAGLIAVRSGVELPAFNPAISGIIAGAVLAWIRMVLRTREKYDPFWSAALSLEPFSEGGWEFIWRFLADIAVGYLVMLVFGTLHVVATTDHHFVLSMPEISGVLLGGGSGSGGGLGGGSGSISPFIVVLVALILAAAIIGALWGATLGSALGLGLCSTHLIRGTAQGATVHLLLAGAKTTSPKYFVGYVLLGAVSGAVEGALVGVLCGGVIDWTYFLK